MKKMGLRLKKRLVGCSVFLLLALGGGLYGLDQWVMNDSGCANTVVQSVPSPDGHLKAVVFVQDCSGLDGDTTQVCVIKAEQKQPHSASDVFLADVGGAPMEQANNIPIRVSWSGRRELRIEYHGRAEVQRQSRYLWIGSGFLRGELVRVQYAKKFGP